MKKSLLLISLTGLLLVSCDHMKKHVQDQQEAIVDSTTKLPADTSVKKKFNLDKLTAVDPTAVKILSENYRNLVRQDPNNAVLIMTSGSSVMAEISQLADRVSYIFGADANNRVVMVLQFYFEASNRSVFYMSTDFMSSRDPGMNGRDALCPPPNGCQIGENITKAK